jgi:hypothetical protein
MLQNWLGKKGYGTDVRAMRTKEGHQEKTAQLKFAIKAVPFPRVILHTRVTGILPQISQSKTRGLMRPINPHRDA